MNILWRHFIVYKSIDHGKRFVFYNNKDKLRAELALLYFIVCTLIDNSYEPISAGEFGQLL